MTKNNIRRTLILLALMCLLGSLLWCWQAFSHPAPKRPLNLPISPTAHSDTTQESQGQPAGTPPNLPHDASHCAESGFSLKTPIHYLAGRWHRASMAQKCIIITLLLLFAGRMIFWWKKPASHVRYVMPWNGMEMYQNFANKVNCKLLAFDAYDIYDRFNFFYALKKMGWSKSLTPVVEAFDKVHMKIYNQKAKRFNEQNKSKNMNDLEELKIPILEKPDIGTRSFGPFYLDLIDELDAMQNNSDEFEKHVKDFRHNLFYVFLISESFWGWVGTALSHQFFVELYDLPEISFLHGVVHAQVSNNNTLLEAYCENSEWFKSVESIHKEYKMTLCLAVYLHHIVEALKDMKPKKAIKAYMVSVAAEKWCNDALENQETAEAFVELVKTGVNQQGELS